MPRRASATLIGLFVVGAAVLAIGATLLVTSGLLRDTSRFVMYFSGSVRGLNVGAPVSFRGVKIGTVTDIRLLFDPDTQRVQIPVYAELDPGRITLVSGEEMAARRTNHVSDMIANGLRAQLQMQSLLTGQIAIQLDIYPNKPAELKGGRGGSITEIPTIPSPLQEFTRKLEEFPIDVLLHHFTSATQGFDKFINGPDLPRALNQFDQTLRDYSALAQRLDRHSGGAAAELSATLAELRETSRAAQQLFGNSNDFLQQLRIDTGKLAISAQNTFGVIQRAADNTNALLSPDAQLQHQLLKTLEEIARSARALRILADTLEQNPEAVIQGKPDEGDQ